MQYMLQYLEVEKNLYLNGLSLVILSKNMNLLMTNTHTTVTTLSHVHRNRVSFYECNAAKGHLRKQTVSRNCVGSG